MLYPPVLFYLFFWAKGMSFPAVLFFWVGLSVLGFGLAGRWLHQILSSSIQANGRWFVIVWALLAAQFPTLFSWERASTDGLIFPAAVGAVLLAQRGRWGWVAAILVFLTAYKLYPVFLLVFVARLHSPWGRSDPSKFDRGGRGCQIPYYGFKIPDYDQYSVKVENLLISRLHGGAGEG